MKEENLKAQMLKDNQTLATMTSMIIDTQTEDATEEEEGVTEEVTEEVTAMIE